MARYESQGGLTAIPLLVLPGAASPTGPEPSALSSSSLSSLCCEVLFGKEGSCCLPKKDEQARGVSLYFTGETLELSERPRVWEPRLSLWPRDFGQNFPLWTRLPCGQSEGLESEGLTE